MEDVPQAFALWPGLSLSLSLSLLQEHELFDDYLEMVIQVN